MSSEPIMITSEISLDDISQRRVAPIDVYLAQVQEWLLKPARLLADTRPQNRFRGMAVLALELMFFEPHGKFLSGRDEKNTSRAMFSLGFKRFRDFLVAKNEILHDPTPLTANDFYSWARCGLFHSSILSGRLLVNAIGYGNKCLMPVHPTDRWLVDPWRVLDCLDEYLLKYVEDVKNDKQPELTANFATIFQKLVSGPLLGLQSEMAKLSF